ncbi:MAG: prolipoprotein diacylglyceryl transferase [Oscillospiraceae bacterium]
MSDVINFEGLGLHFEIDRVAFTLFGRDFYWYGVIIAAAFLLAAIYGYVRAPQFGIKSDDLVDLLIFAVPISIITTRAYYVIFNYDLYRGDFAEVFRLWDGGLAIYGGIIGAVLTAIVFSRVKKLKLGAILDLGALGLLIGQCIGRWGNFVNKEAYGTVTDLPWRMGIYVGNSYRQVHPAFLYESVWNLLGFIFLHIYSKKEKRQYDGQLFLMYVAWYGIGRGVIEGIRTDSLYLFNTGLRVSQVLGFASFIVSMLIMLYLAIFKKHSPEDLLVNKVKAAQAEADAGEETAQAEAGTGEEATEGYEDTSPDDLPEAGTEGLTEGGEEPGMTDISPDDLPEAGTEGLAEDSDGPGISGISPDDVQYGLDKKPESNGGGE